MKRLFDIVGAMGGLVFFGPAMALAAVAIWLDDGRPLLFRQERLGKGRRPFTILDVLHRESLVTLLERHGVQNLSEADIDHMNRAWHRLDPWPDVVEGLVRLKRKRIIAPCSNGNIALMVHLARRAGLPWDCILGAETARAYKPMPEAYLASCRQLALPPSQVMMVAAHNGDLKAAKAQGLATAFVPRPTEYGPGQSTDLAADPAHVDVAARDFIDLEARLDRARMPPGEP